jgi:tetratricopeptide (TPR) repeat protein/TolB-like protein
MIGSHLAQYRIVEKVGEGGMGIVYRAHDEQLQRDVAIKVLPAGSLDDADARKHFKQEALVLARINHPNIATLYGAGAENGIDYLVMEFIPGASLSDRLHSGPLPVPEVIGLAAQISEGLAAAHKRGIIHRDLKPGNIRLTPEGRIKVLDFGLARRAPRASESGASITASQLHETSGTIPYMSPEQLRGQIADERSDVWGVGTVLYELCCGQRPFHGSNPTATAADIIHQPPRPLRALRPEIPVGLEKIIQKCLEKEPANRYQSAEALLHDIVELRDGDSKAGSDLPRTWMGVPVAWLLSGGLIIVIAVLAVIAVHFARPPRGTSKARRSVAVLGFRNVKGVESQDWISTALSEMLTTELAAGEELRAVPGEDVARAKMDLKLPESESLGQGTLRQIRARLDSDLVVVGSYLNINGQLRVDVQVQNAADGSIVANLSESGSEDQLFDIVTRAGASLRAHVGVGGLTSDQLVNVRASQPANLAAAKLYAEGLARLRQFDAAGARDKFEAAIKADPNDALSHAALASAWSQLGYDARAAEQAKVAFDLSTKLAREDRLTIEGAYHTADKQWDKAIDVYRTLYGFFPDRLDYGFNLVDAQIAGGKGQDALATVAKLRQSGVADPRIDLAEARAAASLSDYRRAREANSRAIDAATKQGASFERAQALQQQCWANRNLGQLDEARDAGAKAQTIFEESHNARGEARSLTCVGAVLSDKGDLVSAQQMYEKALGLVQGIGARLDIAGALNNIGNMLAAEGKLEESTAKYQQALTVATEIDDKPDQIKAQINLGVNLTVLGEFRKAQKALQSSIEIARVIGDQQVTAESLINLATVCLYVGELGQAEAHSREALTSSQALGLRADAAYALSVAGDVQLARDDLANAIKSYTEALEIRKQLGDGSAIATSQLALANLAVEQVDLEKAFSIAQDAAQQLHKLGDTEEEAAARTILAKILVLQKKADLSQAELDAAHKLTVRDRTALMATDIASAQLLALKGRPSEAGRVLAQTVERAKSMDYILGQMQARLALGEIQMASAQRERATQDLQLLKEQAAKLGFKLLQRKAEELIKGVNVPLRG